MEKTTQYNTISPKIERPGNEVHLSMPRAEQCSWQKTHLMQNWLLSVLYTQFHTGTDRKFQDFPGLRKFRKIQDAWKPRMHYNSTGQITKLGVFNSSRKISPLPTWGPPITNFPDGWRWYTVCSSRYCEGTTARTTCSIRSWRRSSMETSSECWMEMTIVWTRIGMQAPFCILYSHVTCAITHHKITTCFITFIEVRK